MLIEGMSEYPPRLLSFPLCGNLSFPLITILLDYKWVKREREDVALQKNRRNVPPVFRGTQDNSD